MRITGGKDYYDSALGLGHDDHTVFVRGDGWLLSDKDIDWQIPSIRVALKDDKRFHRQMMLGGRFDDVEFKQHRLSIARLGVIFCGTIHYGLLVQDQERASFTNLFFWQQERFDEWLANIGLTFAPVRWDRDSTQAALDALFAEIAAPARLRDWLIDKRVVIAIRFPQSKDVQRPEFEPAWEINSARMKDAQFYRKVDAYQAFQEIDMWISGVLPRNEMPMTIVDDQTRLAKHGFDRHSFRKSKQ